MREALERILGGAEGIEVVASAHDLDSLIDAIGARATGRRADRHPDAADLDRRGHPGRAEASRRPARRSAWWCSASTPTPTTRWRCSTQGSHGRGYLLKERINDPEQLAGAVRATVEGEAVIDPKVVEVLVKARSISSRSPLSELTPRERDVLAELAQGKSNAAIAQSLVLTKRAVEKHINSIFMKLQLGNPDDVSRRVKAALVYLASGASSRRTERRRLRDDGRGNPRGDHGARHPRRSRTVNRPPVASTRSRSPCSPSSSCSTAPPTPLSATSSYEPAGGTAVRSSGSPTRATYRWALAIASIAT